MNFANAFTPERLQEVQAEISGRTASEELKAAFGLYNVAKRLALYYDGKVTLHLESQQGKGTAVWFIIPEGR